MTTEQFWARVEKGPACWVFRGVRGQRKGDHGRVYIGGKTVLAHRYAWELINGPIPTDKILCHHCDNPPCVRIEHLYLGTHATNARDVVMRHPASIGAKIVAEEAEAIRSLYELGGEVRGIARLYGIRASTVHNILKGKTWRA